MSLHARRTVTLFTVIACCACSGETIGPAESGGDPPYTLRLYHRDQVAKLDLLFMIDNSPSMADKQKILAVAVPDLVERFANPVCVDRATRNQVGTVEPGESCSDRFPHAERELDPIVDIHIGVITSSLGGHGSDSCHDDLSHEWNPRQQDMAHLTGWGKDDDGHDVIVDTYQGLGFLNWDPTMRSDPPGEDRIDQLKTDFAYLVRGASQNGCGFEAGLEAWYRFLIDPAPYERMVPVPCYDGDTNNQCRGPQGIDQVVLAQRKDFLRRDSLLAIVMLTDENDCSVMDGGQNFLALQGHDGAEPFHLARGTDACAIDPWDPECKSCWEVSLVDYPECAVGWPNPALDDPLNLRCLEQKRRFGIDFLYPVRRYIDALSDNFLTDGTLNPLYCQHPTDETRTLCADVLRDTSLVYLAGIVGVPWQDIAVDPNDLKQGYRPVETLSWTPQDFYYRGLTPPDGLPDGKTLWNVILGEVDGNPGSDADGNGMISEDEKNPHYGAPVPTVEPLDPLMRESIGPRVGVQPITGEPLAPPGSDDPLGQSINASERLVPSRDDLQYVCVFDLGAFGPLDCSLPENAFGCDCGEAPDNPLCWDGAQYTTKQYRGKAYPSRRQLAVLKGMDEQGIVASICPTNMTDASASDFGYRPAIGTIVDRLVPRVASPCFSPTLELGSEGLVSCSLLETSRGEYSDSGERVCPPCEGARIDPTARQWRALEADQVFRENALKCACEVEQAPPGPVHDACVTDSSVKGINTWCYVDPEQDSTHNQELVASCPSSNRRDLRFLGDVPAPGTLLFFMCDR